MSLLKKFAAMAMVAVMAVGMTACGAVMMRGHKNICNRNRYNLCAL